MPMDHPPAGQGRRHFHRGRRGSERRATDRRTSPAPGTEQPARDHVDIEQTMRDIRTRIAQRHGIDLTTQQIQDLAARRLESILDMRAIRPELMAQLRRSAGSGAETQPEPAAPTFSFDDATIYGGHRGLVGFLRKIFNPILRLFFDPDPVVDALKAQATLNARILEHEGTHERRQAEWNALHYEILQRVVTEVSRLSLELHALSTRVEALGAKVDFNERRVRSMEGTTFQPRSSARPDPLPAPQAVATEPAVSGPPSDSPTAAGDAPRRRRRRRRGRRSGGPLDAPPGTSPAVNGAEAEDQGVDDVDDGIDDATGPDAEVLPTSNAATDVATGEIHQEATQAPPRDEPATPAGGAPSDTADSGPADR